MSSRSSPRQRSHRGVDQLSRLQRQVEELEHLLDSVDGIVWEADIQTFQFLYVSRQAERLLGYPLESWLAEPDFWERHLHPDDREWAMNFCLTATKEGRDHEFEYRMIAADGHPVWLREIVTVNSVGDGEPVLRGLMVDVSPHKEAEHRTADENLALLSLAKSEELGRGDLVAFNRLAMETAARTLDVERMGVWLFSEDRSVLRCVDLYERSTGRHSDGLELESASYPRYFSALYEGRFVSADDAQNDPKTSEFAESYLAPLGITSMLDAPLIRAGEVIGVVCHEHVGAARKWTLDEREFAASVAHFVSHAVEAQKRREAEQAASAAREQLLDQQKKETQNVEAELERVRDKLVQQTRLSTIGQVAASIAHELRNPLGAIGNARFYLSRRVADDDPKWAEHLGIIDQEVHTADRIITNLLEMTRAKEPSREWTDLGDLARSAFDRVEETDGVRLTLSTRPDPFLVDADPEQLRQVLTNLVTNSVQAMEGRGEIAVVAHSEGDFDVIALQDDGPGIDPEAKELVFEPLYTTKAKGTGLGLPICRQIVERHGGSIELAKPRGPGARMVIHLPRSKARTKEQEAG